MNPTSIDQLVNEYIEAWSTTDAAQRKRLIATVYAENVDFYADEPGDGPVEHHGLVGLFTNITQVNKRLVQGRGFTTERTGYSLNHNVLQVSWQMKTADGQVAMKGMNLLHLDQSGKIVQDYIFIG